MIVWLAAASSASKEPAKHEKTCFDIADEETQVRLWWKNSLIELKWDFFVIPSRIPWPRLLARKVVATPATSAAPLA